MKNKNMERTTFLQKVLKWVPLFGLSLALAIIVIDGTIMNVSIKYIMSDLGISLKEIQTIMTTYTLVVAALTITGGRLGDLFGYKKMFKIGAIIFGIGALIASFSTSGSILLIGWAILEGIGAALMTPATTSLIISTYNGKARNLAFALWGATAGASAAFGPILGGYLTTNYSWRWAFRINLVVVALLLATTVVIKEYITKTTKKYIDFLGVLLSSGGIGLITYGIIQSSDHGWVIAKKSMDILGYSVQPFGYSAVIFMLVAGLLILGAFVLWEKSVVKNGKTPLIDFNIFKDKTFLSGILTGSVITLGQAGIIFSIPIFFQSVLKLDAFQTGIGILPLSLSILVAAPTSMKLAQKIRPKYVIQAGLVISIIGLAILHNTLAITAVSADFRLGLVIFGAGLGLVMAQITNLTLSNVVTGQAGEASGLNSTARQLGQTFGTAIIGAVFLTAMSTSLVDSINDNPVLPAPIKTEIVKIIEDDPSSLQFGAEDKFKAMMTAEQQRMMRNMPIPSGMPQGQDKTMTEKPVTTIPKGIPTGLPNPADMVKGISQAANQASVEGAKQALIYTGAFYALSLAVSTLLPNKKLDGKGGIAVPH